MEYSNVSETTILNDKISDAQKSNTLPTIESPCIKVCKVAPDGKYCIGCYRTLDDLTKWSRASNQEKQQILDAAISRRKSLEAQS
ncbi:DUF1289 domain-containing protein [Kordiimonas sp. SCSIO 12610]|uniref:DUF1289 domain-containing protein n=1 Tax=Kordiimonas sp. SCSIO 12610 TaxID=2829597 RepID=UPI00210A35BF|nr:DUF1289 domain-containing protein [Kordiimonas sp. SCSIO 12610]UTW56056.1 DUF1289 domain-containing protein [Kordiimonas sp. SCSIO 12610]